jgi:TPR repeat protein
MSRFLFIIFLFISSISVHAKINIEEYSTKCFAASLMGNYSEALNWCSPSAEQGDADAQYTLGVMYERGEGVTQDYKQAIKWYALAAEQGLVNAQHDLGFLYEIGLGVTPDFKQAVRWYILAAEQGDSRAQFNLGHMYNNGRGVIQDNVYSHMWFNVSASNGNSDALNNRNDVAKEMTKEQIAEAQKLARECVAKDYREC